jgi:hypothetical protein
MFPDGALQRQNANFHTLTPKSSFVVRRSWLKVRLRNLNPTLGLTEQFNNLI